MTISETIFYLITVALLTVAVLVILAIIRPATAASQAVTEMEGYSSFWRQCVNYECPSSGDKCMARCIKRAVRRSKDKRYW
jgi:hypothetical protein